MLHGKVANGLINKIHKRSLRNAYEMEDKISKIHQIRKALGLFTKAVFTHC